MTADPRVEAVAVALFESNYGLVPEGTALRMAEAAVVALDAFDNSAESLGAYRRQVERSVRERIAQEIEAAADEHNRYVASIAAVPYDPERPDGMVASGIRRGARIARGRS